MSNTFHMIYASRQSLGKATAQAMELAERARGFTDIEIVVLPHPRLTLIEAVLVASKALITSLEHPEHFALKLAAKLGLGDEQP